MNLNKKLTLLTLTLVSAWSANSNIIISTLPVNGTGNSLGPNVMLDLSVEFPTAKTAYSTYSSDGSFVHLSNHKLRYPGYFDPDKCYSYQTANGGYFRPEAAVINATERTCASGYWSGNMLNFGTMSAIDIFRATLTGGNRALGTSGAASEYTNGDTIDITTLRRSRATNGGFNQGPQTEIDDVVTGMSPYGTARLRFINTDWGFDIQSSTNNGASWVAQGRFNAIVEVCRQNTALPSNGLETNCHPYTLPSPNAAGQTTIYKPEGLIQKYGTQMRFGAFGYLLDNTIERNGGVLRARMKYPALNSTTHDYANNAITLGAEWDPITGIYKANPDAADASSSSVANSGVVNYVNKFGDANGYKWYDTAAEMYYASQRYFRKKGNYAPYTNNLTAAMKDNFPVITNWDDPLLGSCQKNFTIYIGDTNTWYDIGLPGLGDGGSHTPPTDDTDFDLKTQLAQISTNEGLAANFYLNSNVGSSGRTPPSIAALALWAHTNDIRTDSNMSGMQTIESFLIDVVENGSFKAGPPVANSFYLAAKYGAFDTSVGSLPPRGNDPSWTSDAPGTSTVPAFLSAGGTPNNYATGDNPTNMVNALEKAFSRIASVADASLAGMSSNAKTQPTLAGSYTFQSSYDSKTWSGDLITRKISFDATGQMTQTEVWRAKSIYQSQMVGGWNGRSIFTLDQNTHTGADFNTTWFNALDASNPQRMALDSTDGQGAKRVDFLRGDQTNEAAGSTPQFRARASLLGDIINSSPAYIAPPTGDPQGCQFNSTSRANILARDPMVAVAANDGLLHVFKVADGKEKFAYLPAAIFSKLPSLTSANYQHDFYNDGSPQINNMCFTQDPATGTAYSSGSQEARSVLVGSTGIGGNAVYALDVTNPATVSKDNVLWEFSAKDDANMGLAVSAPKMTYVQWGASLQKVPVVVFGNGPNSTGGFGTLFVLRMDKKKGDAWQQDVNYARLQVRPDLIPASTAISEANLSNTLNWGTLPLKTTPNGLGGAAVVDHFGRGIADFAYAGDLNGNLWAFNLTSGVIGSGSSHISPALMFVAHSPANGSTPAARQPITAAPLVVTDPSSNCYDRVLFGTGQWYSDADNPIGQQSLYGLCTKALPDGAQKPANTPPTILAVATLNAQTLGSTTVASTSSDTFYGSSTNAIPAGESWYINLLSNERVLQPASVLGSTVARFDSVVPGNGTAGCNATGDSWITEVNLFTGAQSNLSLFDTNGDNTINGMDLPASRVKESTGIAGKSLVLDGWQCNVGETGKLLCDTINPLGTQGTRLSWRQLLKA